MTKFSLFFCTFTFIAIAFDSSDMSFSFSALSTQVINSCSNSFIVLSGCCLNASVSFISWSIIPICLFFLSCFFLTCLFLNKLYTSVELTGHIAAMWRVLWIHAVQFCLKWDDLLPFGEMWLLMPPYSDSGVFVQVKSPFNIILPMANWKDQFVNITKLIILGCICKRMEIKIINSLHLWIKGRNLFWFFLNAI